MPQGPLRADKFLRWAGCAVLVSMAFFYCVPLSAQTGSNGQAPEALVEQLGRIERALDRALVGERTLSQWLESVDSIKDRATECVAKTAQVLEKVRQNLFSLGALVEGEPAEVTRQRKTLEREKTAQENRLATCRVLIQRTEDMLPQIRELQKQLRAQRLLARGPTIFALLHDERLRLGVLVAATQTFIQAHSGVAQLSVAGLAILALIFVIALAVGAALRYQTTNWAQRHRWHRNLSSHLGRSLVTTFGHYVPYLLLSVAAATFFFFATRQVRPLPFLSVVAYGLPPYFLVVTIIHTFFAPFAPAEPFLPLPKDVARALAKCLKVLVLLVFLGYLLFATFLAQDLPEPALLLARAVFAAVFFANLSWALWLVSRIPGLSKTLWLHAVALLVLLSALVAELVGYRILSVWLLRAVIGTLVAVGILALALRLFRELFDGLQRGRHPWHRRLRQGLALKPSDHVPGLGWMRLITATFLWLAFALGALRIWGLPETTFQQLYSYVADGFTVGSLRINPARIVLAVITLTVLLALTGWIRSRLSRKWLSKTRMERGAREATVTITSYAGVAIAIVVALAVTGLEFTNLAIIAGALSVGIGFGLQNVVNNFVSGLILLFERPIKTGDWIVVGDTEGYVKRISIRSTQIQTFDRADVIVPNSDLVSKQVTNWMLHEPRGRIRVPVGVAYGSDTEKVRDILLEIARAHPEVICDASAPLPKVFFLTFGDSALNFELRCHIQNIDERRQVTSDLNFAIDKAFREHGIEIPFPQRDLHVRDWRSVQKDLPMPEEKGSGKRTMLTSTRRAAKDNPDSSPADDD